MLAQRNGLPPGCKPVPLKDHSDLRDVDVNAVGCCSLSSSPSSGGCPWARLAGVDGCLSEPYCLWFQLLARAYWGEVELGLTSPNRSVSWARLREASRKNCVRSRVRTVYVMSDGWASFRFWGNVRGKSCYGLEAFKNCVTHMKYRFKGDQWLAEAYRFT